MDISLDTQIHGRGGPDRPTVIILSGPTASGKTALGLALALRMDGEIVSADSVQVHRFMDIGSAKPTPRERALVPHHMIDICDPDEDFTAGDYVRKARRVVSEILERKHVPLVVGGTGLYIRLLMGGVVPAPARDLQVRDRLTREADAPGGKSLFERLSQVDPVYAAAVGPRNLPRLLRALEVFELTGKTLSSFQRSHRFGDRLFRSLHICLNPPRSILYERIDKRVDLMIQSGLLEEVSRLVRQGWPPDIKPMRSLGYRHAWLALSGAMTLEDAAILMKRDTRRYAKRQITWFRSEPEALWWDPQDEDGIRLVVDDFLGR
jgi:tRNA dimethylallyltransferase